MFGALSLAAHLRYALIIILVVVIVILLSKWTGSGNGGSCNTSMSQKFGKFARLNQGKDTASSAAASAAAVAQKLMTESREWARETDSPTISPVGQLVNATYALSYAQASQALALPGSGDKEADALINDMKAKQSQAVQYLAKTYPSIV